jgi:hypothetical protein
MYNKAWDLLEKADLRTTRRAPQRVRLLRRAMPREWWSK